MRVVIGEDHALLRDGLVRLLEAHGVEVVAAVATAPDLEHALATTPPDAAIVDVRLPPTHTDEGLRVAIAARRARPDLPVLVLSQYVEVLYARELLESGSAVGYLLKERVADIGQFLDSLHVVASGGIVLDPHVVAQMTAARRRTEPIQRLTARETEALELMAQGRGNAAIADLMCITEKAVAKHINNIFAKLGLPPDTDGHRRVLAVLRFLESSP